MEIIFIDSLEKLPKVINKSLVKVEFLCKCCGKKVVLDIIVWKIKKNCYVKIVKL